MRPIPLELRKQLSEEPFMRRCIHPGCSELPEWEHCWIYAGKQINEDWAIVPCCVYHHRGDGMDKDFNRWVSINLAGLDDLLKYPKKDWIREKERLNDMYKQNFKDYLITHTTKCLTS